MPQLSVAAVARKLGIAPATLRTWDRRYGIGPANHAPGRHRRYSADDVARLELMRAALLHGATPAAAARYALSTPLPRLRPPPPIPDTDETTLHQGGVGRGCPSSRRRMACPRPGPSRDRARRRRGSPPAQRIDRRRGRTDHLGPHGATGAGGDSPTLGRHRHGHRDRAPAQRLRDRRVQRAGRIHPDHPRAPVLLAGMAGDQHRLPIVVLAATLAQRGVACRSLGTDLPADALVAAIRRTAPAALLLWSQLADTADPDLLMSLPRTRPGFRIFIAAPDGRTSPSDQSRPVELASRGDRRHQRGGIDPSAAPTGSVAGPWCGRRTWSTRPTSSKVDQVRQPRRPDRPGRRSRRRRSRGPPRSLACAGRGPGMER